VFLEEQIGHLVFSVSSVENWPLFNLPSRAGGWEPVRFVVEIQEEYDLRFPSPLCFSLMFYDVFLASGFSLGKSRK